MHNLIKKFQDKEKFFQFVVDQMDEAIIITSLDTKIIYINPAAEILFGYKKEEVIGQDPIIFNAENNSIDIQNSIHTAMQSGQKWDGIIYNKKKDGSLFYINLLAIPYIENNEIICFVGFQKDINDLQKAKKDLQISDNRYRTIFDNAPDYINLIDQNGIIIDSNRRSEELLGYKKEELVGQHYSKIVHPDYIKQAEYEMSYLTKNQDIPSKINEYKMVKKNGDIIFVNARTTFLSGSNGDFLHTICFIIDITEIKKSEKILLSLTEDLKRSNKELEQFAYVASHDLQEPLRVISSYCQLLNEKCAKCIEEDSEIKKFFYYIIDATSRMKILVKDLLEYSRLNKKDSPLENINIMDIISEAKEDFKLRIKEKNATIIINVEFPTITGIRFRIKQLFYNLISNALKFTSKDRDSRIIISVKDHGEKYLFCVEDNGIGIDKKYNNHIFGLFKKLHSRDEYSGSGIGLAICKRIVNNCGGEIWVESELGNGSKFYFTLSKKYNFSFKSKKYIK